MPEDLQKSYVAAHYRHAPNGGLVFVHGYTNKVVAAPEDLTNEYFKEHGIEPEGEPLSNPGDATTSFRVGDEVFVKYSHLHDQHFLTGMVVGVRKDKWHKGKLVLVKEPTGIVEAYAPASLAHVKKQEHESRKHEIEPHLDETGKHIKYQHLTDEQLVRFHDLHRLWYRLHRMGEALAYKDNKDLFVKPDGSLPKSKKDLSSQQKIQLEKLNPFPVVPVEKLIGLVSQSSYNDASHVTAANKLLEEIKALEKSGAPTIKFPSWYTGKSQHSKKVTVPPPSYWFQGMFPLEETDKEPSKEELEDLQFKITQATGSVVTKDQTPALFNKDVIYAGGVHTPHGAVQYSTTKYKPVVKINKHEASAAELPPPTPPKKADVDGPTPYIKTEVKDISDLKFEVVANAWNRGFSGIHSKYILKGSDGKEYLFKPYYDSEAQRPWADIIAARVAQVIGLPTARFGSKPVTVHIPHHLGGNYAGAAHTGSVQEILPASKHGIIEYAKKGFVGAPQSLIERLQKEHVLDWLIGNNDAHGEQFITVNGELVGVDKGQAFRHYEQDVLDIGYDPNQNKKSLESVYTILLRSAKAKKIHLDWKVSADFIKTVKSALSQKEFADTVKPFALNSVKWSDAPFKLQNLATKRLYNLEKDFQNLYEQNGLLGKPKKKKAAEETQYIPDAFSNIDDHFISRVNAAGPIGSGALLGGGDIEDMSAVFTSYSWKEGGKGLLMEAKVLHGSEPKMINFFETVGDHTIEAEVHNGSLDADHDPFGAALINAAKTINHHVEDKEYNQGKINSFKEFFVGDDDKILPSYSLYKKILEYLPSDKFPERSKLAKDLAFYYLPLAEQTWQAYTSKSKTPSKDYKIWSGEIKSTSDVVSKHNHPFATYPKFSANIESNTMEREPGERSAPLEGASLISKYGVMFKKVLPGNIEVRYYPHYSSALSGQNNLRSQQGRLIVDLKNWDGSASAAQLLPNVLGMMGLDHKLATPVDLECLYLTRVAWQQKGDVNTATKAQWKNIAAMANSNAKIEELKKLCEKLYGSSPDSLPTYNPVPHSDGDGHHYFLNPYVLDKVLAGKNELALFHTVNSVYSSKPSIVKNVTKSLARFGLLSTEMRHRAGIGVAGNSSFTDQKTGGASYVFLSGARPGTGGSYQFEFDPKLLARTDMFAYLSDNFGGTHIENGIESKKGIGTRVAVMELLGNDHAQDIMFKNRIPLRWVKKIGSDLLDTMKNTLSDKEKQALPERIKELIGFKSSGE